MRSKVLAYRAREEKYKYNSRSNPERAVEIWVPVQDVEEGAAGDESGKTALEHGGGVDVKELGVEGEGPEVAF